MKFAYFMPKSFCRSSWFVRLAVNFTVILLFLGCIRQPYGEPILIENIVESEKIEVYIDPAFARAQEIVSGMDNRLLAAQVLISGIDGAGRLRPYMAELLTEIPTGGIMLFKYNLDTDNDSIRSLVTQTKAVILEESGIAPFMAVDHEGGSVIRFNREIVSLPSAAAYWEVFEKEGMNAALLKIARDSLKDALVINELGINMNFAPVAEHLTDDNRVFYSRRSYGPDPDFTARASLAFLQSMEKAGIICVVKHFPASAGTDPHYSKSVLNSKEDELDELVSPFAYLIKKGARAIMAAHTLIPAVDSEIASLSSVVMRNWLRGGLGFDGIIVSDDFIMAAAGNQKPETAAVLSLAAGSDMILVWPANLRKTHNAIITAVENESLSRDRLADAAVRIVYQKITMGLMD